MPDAMDAYLKTLTRGTGLDTTYTGQSGQGQTGQVMQGQDPNQLPFWQWPQGTNWGTTGGQPTQQQQPNPTLAKTDVTDATNIYNQMVQQGQADLAAQGLLPGQGPAAISIGTPPPTSGQDDSWRNRIYQERADAANRRQPYGPTAGTGTAIPEEPTRKGPAPVIGEVSLDLPDYQPPKDTSRGAEKRKREEIYQTARGDLQEQTHNAIISAKSLDNPMAQAQFVSEVLRGMGQGLGDILGQASGAASSYAAQKRAEELGIYNAKFQAESQEAMAAYDAELQQAMAQWQADMSAWESGEQVGRTKVTRAVDNSSQARSGGRR